MRMSVTAPEGRGGEEARRRGGPHLLASQGEEALTYLRLSSAPLLVPHLRLSGWGVSRA